MKKKIVVKNAEKNAEKELDKKFNEQKNNIYFLQKIKNVFKLKKIPKIIEIYDISHISGEFAVGAVVSFNKDGFIMILLKRFIHYYVLILQIFNRFHRYPLHQMIVFVSMKC